MGKAQDMELHNASERKTARYKKSCLFVVTDGFRRIY